MFCDLLIMDEEWIIESNSGRIQTETLKKTIKIAEQLNLTLLPFIDEKDENIFNILQLQKIKDELLIIQSNFFDFDPREFNILITAVDDVLKEESYTYLKITRPYAVEAYKRNFQ